MTSLMHLLATGAALACFYRHNLAGSLFPGEGFDVICRSLQLHIRMCQMRWLLQLVLLLPILLLLLMLQVLHNC